VKLVLTKCLHSQTCVLIWRVWREYRYVPLKMQDVNILEVLELPSLSFITSTVSTKYSCFRVMEQGQAFEVDVTCRCFCIERKTETDCTKVCCTVSATAFWRRTEARPSSHDDLKSTTKTHTVTSVSLARIISLAVSRVQ